MSGEQKIGLYQKFKVERTDGSSAPGEKHEHCRYFVLDLVHDPYAKPAILSYAKACAGTHPILAQDLREQAEHFKFKGGRGPIGVRCIGPKISSHDTARCERRYKGQKGWDFIGVRPLEGWVCPDCRKIFREVFSGPGLDAKPKRRRPSMAVRARQNARAFGSTKSKDGMYPI